jgi:peptidoglycan hydrolase CwlO-like protein
MSTTINPEIRDLQQKYEDLRVALAKTQGEVEEIKCQTAGNTRQTIWQFVIFTVTMAGVLIGGLTYQTNALRHEFGARFDTVDAKFNTVNGRLDNLEKRMDRIDRSLDELNKELRSQRR